MIQTLASLYLELIKSVVRPGPAISTAVLDIVDPYRSRAERGPSIRRIEVDDTGLAVLEDDARQVPLQLAPGVSMAQLAAALGPAAVEEERESARSQGQPFPYRERLRQAYEEIEAVRETDSPEAVRREAVKV